MLDLARARERMVDVQISRRGVRDSYVLEALRRVPREAFERRFAFELRRRGYAAAPGILAGALGAEGRTAS